MANELNIDIGIAGLSPTAQLIQGNAAVDSAIALTESLDLAGYYSGNMPAVAAGVYAVAFRWDSGGVGSGVVEWDGTAEITKGAIASAVAQVPLNPLLTTDTRLDALDAPISTRSVFDATADTVTVAANQDKTGYALTSAQVAVIRDGLSTLDGAGVQAALTSQGYTSTRAPYLDALNVAGALANADNAALFRADVSGIPTNPLLSTDARLDNLDATISSRLASVGYTAPLDSTQTQAAVESGLTAYTAATAGNVADVGDAIAALNDLSTADAQTAAAAALTAQGYTTGRAPFLDKLNVSGALAHSDAAALYQADVSGLSTFNPAVDQVISSNMRGTDDALLAASYIAPLSTAQTESAVESGLTTYGAATGSQVDAIPVNPLLTTDARLNNLDAAISSRLSAADYTVPLNSGQTQAAVEAGLTSYTAATSENVAAVGDAIASLNDLSSLDAQAAAVAALTAQGYTTGRAPLLDKLDVTGTLAHSDAAALYQADVSGLSTFNPAVDEVIASNMRGTDNALLAANYVAPLSSVQAESAVIAGLTDYGAATGSAVAAIPTTPLLTDDSRLNNLDATISSRLSTAGYVAPLNLAQTEGAVETALGSYGSATATELDKAVTPIVGLTELDGGLWRFTGKALELSPVGPPSFEPADRTRLLEVWQRNGLAGLTSTRVGNTVTESFGAVTLTQVADTAAQQVTVTRS